MLKTLVAGRRTTMSCESVAPLRTNVLYLRLHYLRLQFVSRQFTCRTYDNYAAE